MADRYLLESSGVDGYLLEDASGVLLLDEPIFDSEAAVAQGVGAVSITILLAAFAKAAVGVGALTTVVGTDYILRIYNLALQKLGAARLASRIGDSRNLDSCAACYVHLRDAELRSRAWKFAIKRASVTASATVPTALIDVVFPAGAAYPLPSDCLRVLLPPRTFNDWVIENIAGAPAIITNDGGPLTFRYIAQITDAAIFDICFIEMLACRMADQMCEELTQSSTKKADIREDYTRAKNLARQMNAYEALSTDAPEDSWSAARRSGSSQAPWLRRQNG